MINWDKNISEPPPTKSISVDDLRKIGNGEKKLTEFIPKVMSHSIGKKLSKRNEDNILELTIPHTSYTVQKKVPN